jgi:hypothetical protein
MSVRESEIAKIAESKEARAALEKHLEDVIDGPAFKGSNRSGLFLRHVINRAIGGNFDSLKERSIGMELFGRSASYATGEDAIVRVTANDVRKRLLQHYDKYRTESEFRINLPPGSYIPEIIWANGSESGSLKVNKPGQDPSGASSEPVDLRKPDPASIGLQKPVPETGESMSAAVPLYSGSQSSRRWLIFASLFGALNLVLFGLLFYGMILLRSARNESVSAHNQTKLVSILPWSAFFSSPDPTHLITSDPDLVEIQNITGSPVSVSDYANHVYVPVSNAMPPKIKQICADLLSGDKAASVDTQVVAEVSALAQSNSKTINITAARHLQFSNLKSDDNFIFLGSPRSDPWVRLFEDQLDFRFVIDKTGLENIYNRRPQPGEQSLYVPNSKRGATGQSFAIIAFVQNPDQNGQALILAGANAAGTQVAGKLVTDLARFSMALNKCGISASNQIKHFELLLRVNMMASSPSVFDVEACHVLPETSAH